jgi:pentatricopeptide repeat protein
MIKCGVKPDASIWTAVFDGYSAFGAWRESLATWDTMLTQGVEPEPLTYRAIIATLFKARRPDDAMTKFKEYEQNWVGKGKNIRQTLQTSIPRRPCHFTTPSFTGC